MSENVGHLSGRKGLQQNLFEAISRTACHQTSEGKEELEQIRQDFLVGKATLVGTRTFYDFLRPENQNKKAWICNGSACLLAGTQSTLRRDLENHFASEEIGEMCCLGRCHENNAVHYNGANFSGSFQVADVLHGTVSETDSYLVRALGQPLLTGAAISTNELTTIVRSWIARTSEDRISELKTSGLKGRGGAGFPFAVKADACRLAEGNEKYIVCNADEGDPGAFSDRYLMEHQPLLVLGGILLAGVATGASWGVVYVRAEYPESISVLEKSIRTLYETGLAGPSVAGTGFTFDFKIIRAQGAYICGEETALLNSIEGQRPEVRIRPPYPATQGLFNRPTVVSNVETMANLPSIAKRGGQWFAGIGTAESTGTKLLSLDGHFNKPGIVEVPMGTPLKQVIDELGKGFRKLVKALHIGGPLGGVVPTQKMDQLTIDFKSFQQAGFLLGHGSIVCIPQEFPMPEYAEHLFAFTAHESCGKCFPCRLGSTRGKELLVGARQGKPINPVLFQDLLETMESGSLCMLGGGLPLPIRNLLEYFPEEFTTCFSNPERP